MRRETTDRRKSILARTIVEPTKQVDVTNGSVASSIPPSIPPTLVEKPDLQLDSSLNMKPQDDILSRLGLYIAVVVQLYFAFVATCSLLPTPHTILNTSSSSLEGGVSRSMRGVAYAGVQNSTSQLFLGASTYASATSFSAKNDLQQAVQLWLSDQPQAMLDYGPIADWDVSAVTDMSSLFRDATTFDDDLSRWNLSNCDNVSHMFHGATSFTSDLSSWDLSQAIDLSHMFDSATSFNGDLSTWKLDSAIDLSYMMKNAESFNGNVASWLKTTSPTTGSSSTTGQLFQHDQNMVSMFEDATSFEGNGLQEWNTVAVTNMKAMFRNAAQLRHVGTRWNVHRVRDFSYLFQGTPNLSPVLQLCWDIHENANVMGMFQDGSLDLLGCDDDEYFIYYYRYDDDNEIVE